MRDLNFCNMDSPQSIKTHIQTVKLIEVIKYSLDGSRKSIFDFLFYNSNY